MFIQSMVNSTSLRQPAAVTPRFRAAPPRVSEKISTPRRMIPAATAQGIQRGRGGLGGVGRTGAGWVLIAPQPTAACGGPGPDRAPWQT